MDNPTYPKAFGFARVSSDEQARGGISLGLQADAIRRYCRENGLDLVRLDEVAETASFDDQRVKFKALLSSFAANPDIQHLVFYKVDRSGRNIWDHARLAELVTVHDKHIHAALDHFHLHKESPPSEWDRFDLMAMFARSETRHLSARVRSCIAQQTEQGHWSYKAPPGYRKQPRAGIEPDPVQASRMTALLELAATGRYSLDRLTEENRKLGATYQGKLLSRSQIHRWVVDPVFAGPFYTKGKLVTNYRHKPLISWETHEKILSRLSDYRRSEKKTREPLPLNGIFECAVCGKSFTFFKVKGDKYRYGFCSSCKRSGIKQEFLDERKAVAGLKDLIRGICLSPETGELLRSSTEALRRSEQEARAARLAVIEGNLDRLQGKLAKAFSALTEGIVDEKTYSEQTRNWRKEREQLEIEQRQLAGENTPGAVDSVLEAFKLAEGAETIVDSATPRELGLLARTVCSNLYARSATLEFSLAFPFDLIAEGNKDGGWRAVGDAYRTKYLDPLFVPGEHEKLIADLLAA